MEYKTKNIQKIQGSKMKKALGLGFASVLLASSALIVPSFLHAKSVKPTYKDWPKVESPFKKDAAQEAEIKKIVSQMTLRQKIGQMTQPEIKKASPEDVKKYYIGSVLNGGGSWPNLNKKATAKDWLDLSQAYYDASMSSDMKTPVPVIWGIDAVHGNNNVMGATLYPHNIGLGAARDSALIGEIAAATAKAVRATGIQWAFAPTLAVAQDQRWGRSYESFSQNPYLIRQYAVAFVNGMQGALKSDTNTIATAKHFIGDGGTLNGVDQGQNFATENQMINTHAQGYYGALGAGAQTVMATYNTWENDEAGPEKGKVHGIKKLLTTALKEKMGFDGLVVSDWNAIEQVKGCTVSHCPQAINAGIDLVMVPDDWKAFIENTVKDVEEGRIPMSRIDDAVTRIIRVKMRAGMFHTKPIDSKVAGKDSALSNKSLARRAVRESLVLLKNNNNILPLSRDKKVLVVGHSADSFTNQSGGWSLTWQGDENTNKDFINGDTFLGAIKSELGGKVTYSADGKGVNPKNFDVIIAVVGETPYAEGKGDIRLPAPLTSNDRLKADKDALAEVSGKGVPVVTVLYSGRTLYANDLLNSSKAMVAAWLPGTEAKGLTDVLFRKANGKINYDFNGRLSFNWPSNVCPPSNNVAQASYKPLFNYGYGLRYGQKSNLGALTMDNRKECPVAN